MKVIIAGSRGVTNQDVVNEALRIALAEWAGPGVIVEEVVSGGARGVDRLGEDWAHSKGIPVRRFAPHWDRHGKKAGMLRNAEMAEYADALVAVWDGNSRGTQNMIDEARYRGLLVHVSMCAPAGEREKERKP